MRLLAALLLSLNLLGPASAQTVGPGGGGSGSLTLTGDCSGAGSGSFALGCNSTPTPRYMAGKYFLPLGQMLATAAGATSGANRIQCTPGDIGTKLTIGGAAAVVTTLGSGNFQTAIYTDVGGQPGSLVGNSNSMSTAATGATSATMVANVQVGPGTASGRALWFCMSADNSAVMLPIQSVPGMGASLMGSATITNVLSLTVGLTGLQCLTAACAGVYSSPISAGSWPSTLVGTTWTELGGKNTPAAAYLINSIP